jgi:hypothetical protein
MTRFRYWVDGDRLLRYDGEMAGFPRGAILRPDGGPNPAQRTQPPRPRPPW